MPGGAGDEPEPFGAERAAADRVGRPAEPARAAHAGPVRQRAAGCVHCCTSVLAFLASDICMLSCHRVVCMLEGRVAGSRVHMPGMELSDNAAASVHSFHPLRYMIIF